MVRRHQDRKEGSSEDIIRLYESAFSLVAFLLCWCVFSNTELLTKRQYDGQSCDIDIINEPFLQSPCISICSHNVAVVIINKIAQ